MSFWPDLATLGELGTAETINPMTTVRVKLVRAADIAKRMKIILGLTTSTVAISLYKAQKLRSLNTRLLFMY